MEQANSYVSNVVDTNPYLYGIVLVIGCMYASLAAPKLPKNILVIFDYLWFKALFMFLILLVGTRNITVSIIVSVGIMLTLYGAKKLSLNDVKKLASLNEKEINNNNSSKKLDSLYSDGFELSANDFTRKYSLGLGCTVDGYDKNDSIATL